MTYLIRQHSGTEVTKRQLQLAGLAVQVDFESDQGILRGRSGMMVRDCHASGWKCLLDGWQVLAKVR